MTPLLTLLPPGHALRDAAEDPKATLVDVARVWQRSTGADRVAGLPALLSRWDWRGFERMLRLAGRVTVSGRRTG